jgi:hypothetical protein
LSHGKGQSINNDGQIGHLKKTNREMGNGSKGQNRQDGGQVIKIISNLIPEKYSYC